MPKMSAHTIGAIILLYLFSLSGFCVAPAFSSGLLLAKDRQARLPIVISPQAMAATEKYQWGLVTPIDGVRQVADDLAASLERMTGAKFTVTAGDGSRGIVLGQPEDFPALKGRAELAKALERRQGYDGIEALAIRTEPGRLLLLGSTVLGAAHAAARLLDTLGCRWYFPGDAWRITPSRPTLRVKVNLNDRPKILTLSACYGYNWFDDRCFNEYRAWQHHNLVGSSLPTYTGHIWPQIVEQYRKEFDAHPEYFALRKTVDAQTGALVKEGRDVAGSRLCVSNPAVVEICTRYALDYFATNPNAPMVSMCPGDYGGGSVLGGHCQCARCAAIGNGSVSDQAFFLANQVAKTVAVKCPGKLIGILAYDYTADVPSFPLEPNVYVELTSIFVRGQHTYDQLLDLWPKKAANLGFYDYYSVFHWDRGGLSTRGSITAVRKQITDLAARGAKSFNPEISCSWIPYGPSYYLTARLRWNPQANVDALLQDFYTKAFGPAAQPMQRYYERTDPGRQDLITVHHLGLAMRDLQQATRLAAGRPDVLARLDQIKLYRHYMRLRQQLDQANDKDRKKAFLQQLFTLSYRTRYDYIVDWAWIRFWWAPQAANEYQEPSWERYATNESWRNDGPYTRQEIDALFAEDRAYYETQIQQIEEKSFSDDLVPVQFVAPGTPVGLGNSASWQGPAEYWLYSVAGEPLRVSAIPGTIPYYRDKAPAYYKVTDVKGNAVSSGNLPLDGEEHRLEFTVPAPGRYLLTFDDSDSGWTIKAAADCPLTLPGNRTRSARGGWWWCFYVPRGTRQFQYYSLGNSYGHKCVRPDGTYIEVKEDGQITTVAVPAGMDGKLWSFAGTPYFQNMRARFFNIPNYTAAAPNALMVPREVAIKDGLTIRKGPEKDIPGRGSEK